MINTEQKERFPKKARMILEKLKIDRDLEALFSKLHVQHLNILRILQRVETFRAILQCFWSTALISTISIADAFTTCFVAMVIS